MPTDLTQWVDVQSDDTVHASLSNLPLREWHDGVTLCWQKTELRRLDRLPFIAQKEGRVCQTCVKELRDTHVEPLVVTVTESTPKPVHFKVLKGPHVHTSL